ncbi:hypothetical protein ACIA5D_36915 [Actinoplanes sp. NPDC051513]|uniref:hypothetical protein n=1 Tax=Actinoplanes sp. NPDC051513 TaxID=3363908 RepID=UPI00378D5388
MDRLVALQDAIDHTAKVAGLYRPPEVWLEMHAVDLAIGGDRNKTSWTTGALQRGLVTVAERHAAECRDIDTCYTCAAIRDALATCLSALAWMQDDELEQRYSQG